MRERRAFFITIKNLVRFVSISMVVGVPLYFEQSVVAEYVRHIPRVPDVNCLINTILILLPDEAIVLYIVSFLES